MSDVVKVLDQGEVEMIDEMAGDHKVFGSARVSTGKTPAHASKGMESDKGLISFLMKNGHGTPFEHSVFQFFIKAPIFVVREWQRHRIGSYNEQSGRYSPFKPEFYVPQKVRVQDPVNKQGSIELVEGNHAILVLGLEPDIAMRQSMMSSFHYYEMLMRAGVAREMARMVLPVSMYTSMWWTVNARSLMNFIALRNSDAAQYEIRAYAEVIEAMFARMMPWTHEAFVAGGREAP